MSGWRTRTSQLVSACSDVADKAAEQDMEQIELTRERWQNRRRMAWACVWASVGYPFLLVAQVDGTSLAQIAMPFYLFSTGVVAVYIGAATVDDKWQKDV